ncbi:MAG: amidohydrolase [Bacteroidetes bacterium]|nr:MAG: amidohydrolase [Bacteroidota bacterium]TAG88328.1 MAG: amidohydrolase [Bacteroidota bacterium]
MKKNTLVSLLTFILVNFSYAQAPVPASAQSKPIILSNATIHIGNGQVLNNASIRFENGIIKQIGTQVEKNGAEDINLNGQHIYPSLILPATSLGLTEVGSLRPTHDYEEAGDFNPNVRAMAAYNVDSEITPTLRSNGILLAQIMPRGGMIAGTSSVVELEGWSKEDAQHTIDNGLHINWIPMFFRGGFFSPSGNVNKNEKRDEQIKVLQDFFVEALSYFQKGGTTPKNLKMEAMKGIFDGSKTLYIHTSFGREIIESVQFAQKYQVKKIVIVGGEDCLPVADFMRENNIGVLLSRVHRLPYRPEQDVWEPYQMAAKLKSKGVLVGLTYDENDNEPMGARNLVFLAGTCAAHGLDKESALATVTSNTAKILGIDSKVGTLEVGKEATLVVSEGDILDMRTSKVVHGFVRGKKIDLNDKQKELYQRYKQKYSQK